MKNYFTPKTKIQAVQVQQNFDEIEAGWLTPYGENWNYYGADAPVYVVNITGDLRGRYCNGMRVKVYQNTGGWKYFIVVDVSYAAPNTYITLYGGTDYSLANEALSFVYFSREKCPAGFPLNPDKWKIEYKDVLRRTQSTPTQNAVYNINGMSIVCPIGVWDLEFFANSYSTKSGGQGTIDVSFALSTANNAISDIDLQVYQYISLVTGNVGGYLLPCTRRKRVVLAAKATYYLVEKTGQAGLTTLEVCGDLGATIIRAVCGYL